MKARRLLLALLVLAAQAGADEHSPRFAAFDVYLDSAGPVAAWQFELSDRDGAMKVVGVERGESAAFERVPYYDRDAVDAGRADRIIVADYSLADAARLPTGRTRIATVHLMLEGDNDFDLRLTTATTPDGGPVPASLSFVLRNGREQ